MRRVLFSFSIMLLLPGALLAQTTPDFSGVFLLTALKRGGERWGNLPPRILEVKQSAKEITITIMRNGETMVMRCSLDGKESSDVQARVKGKDLILSAGGIARQPGAAKVRVEETWELSADARQLTIRRKLESRSSFSETETYARQPTLDAAQAAARSDGGKCNQGPEPTETRKDSLRSDDMELLGRTEFPQLTRCVSFAAYVWGDFFRGLKQSGNSDHPVFHKDGKSVVAFTGDIALGVQPSLVCGTDLGLLQPQARRQAAEQFQHLRFLVRWVGTEVRDLGEVKADVVEEPWELDAPSTFYQMQIAAKGIPLSDDLEITIFTADAKQLGCVKAHI